MGLIWGEDAQFFRHYYDAVEVGLGDHEHRCEIGDSKNHNYGELDKEMFAWVRCVPGLLSDLPFRPHLRRVWLIAFLPAILKGIKVLRLHLVLLLVLRVESRAKKHLAASPHISYQVIWYFNEQSEHSVLRFVYAVDSRKEDRDWKYYDDQGWYKKCQKKVILLARPRVELIL